MAWMYMTPIMYSVDIIPTDLRPLFMLNPMTSIIIAYRDILYYGKVPDLVTLFNALVLGVIVLAIGIIVFTKLKKQFAEEL